MITSYISKLQLSVVMVRMKLKRWTWIGPTYYFLYK